MVDKKKFWDKKIISWENGRYQKENHKLGILEKISDKFSNSLKFRLEKTKSILSNRVENKIVVEIGCGSGFLANSIIKNGAKFYYGFDISQNAINRAKTIAEKNDISNKTSFKALSILNLKKIDADIYFSLGTLDWLDDNEINYLFSLSANSDFLHSISEKRISFSQYMHRLYVFLSYKRKTKNYSPRYLKIEKISKIINLYNSKKIHIYRNKKLSFGTLISSFDFE